MFKNYPEHPRLKEIFDPNDTSCSHPKEVEREYLNLRLHNAPMEDFKELLESHGIKWDDGSLKDVKK